MTVAFEEAPALPDWLAPAMPFARRMARVDGRRMHLVDHGQGRAVLLLHGNPTWSFLWRKVMTRLDAGRFRMVAPDLIGFGYSDQPAEIAAHSLDLHVRTVLALVEALDLKDCILVAQDWGGPIGAGVAARTGSRVTAAVLGNTTVLTPRRPLRTSTFHRLSRVPVVSDLLFRGLGFPLPVLSRIQGDPRSIGPLERRAYALPFRGWAQRAGPLALARMVPDREGHPTLSLLEEGERWARGFRGPAALVWGTKDPILGRAHGRLKEAMPGAELELTSAGHFLQEEVPERIAAAIERVADHQR